MNVGRTIGATLIVWTGATWALDAWDVDAPLRAPIAIAYLLIAPGWAVIRLLGLEQAWVVAVLAVASSLGIVTVVSTALLLANLWTPGRALVIVGCITVVAAVGRLGAVARQPRSSVLGHVQTEGHDHAN